MEAAGNGEFPVTRCAVCDRDMLCHFDLEADDATLVRCIECGTAAVPTAVRWLPLAELEALGWGAVLPESGCGRPDCGKGRCGRAAG